LIKALLVDQMSADDNPSEEKEPQVTASLLQRLLRAVENNTRSRRLEIASAVLLGLAATASAWCGYQSNLWTGVQTFSLVAADEAARKSTQLTLQATQLQTIDLVFFTTFVEASFRGEKKLADFALMRFRPEARRAVDAWLQTDPFNNPNAPVRPLAMAEYASPEREAAKRADEEQARMLGAAQQASRSSDEYVLLTVRFAAVLFFGGIVSTFESQRLRTSVFLLAAALFTLSTIVLATLPICRE
jgi:hypothetical protein